MYSLLKDFYSHGFPGGSVVKNPLAISRNTGETGSTSGLGRSPGGKNDNPLQSLAGYSP